jgi:4-amino-4-deoxy-L-arabinose transferase-like glycosyltransferase
VICYLRLQQPQFAGWLYRIGFVVLFVAALHTHYFTTFILAAVNLHFLAQYFKTRRQPTFPPAPVRWWMGLNAIVLLACIPWLFFVWQHPAEARVRHDWRSLVTLMDGIRHLRDLFLQMTVGYSVYPEDLRVAFSNYRTYPEAADARHFFYHRFLIFGVGVPVMIGVFITGLWRMRRQAGITLLLFFVPLLLILILMFVAQREMSLSRYLMITSPYFGIILAVGLASLKTVGRRILTASSLMLAMGLALMTYYNNPIRGSDYRPIAQILKQQVQPGDVIVADPSFMDRCLMYYLESPALWRAIINTDSATDTPSNYLHTHASLPRVWLVLDHRSDLFRAESQTLRSLWSSYEIHLDAYFPEPSSSVRLLQLQYARKPKNRPSTASDRKHGE